MDTETIPARNRTGRILRFDDRHWTYDELDRVVGETMERFEIIDGVLYMSPGAHAINHQRVLGDLFYAMKTWVDAHGLGEVFLAPTDVVLRPDRVVQPDLFFMTASRMDAIERYASEPPDLAVEIVSAWGQKYDRKTKFALYQQEGIREYWLVDSKKQSIEIFVLREGIYTNSEHSEVLNGFQVSAQRLFR